MFAGGLEIQVSGKGLDALFRAVDTRLRAIETRSALTVAGTRVEARFEDGAEWFSGVLAAVHADGTVDIAYDDGDRENRVSPVANRVRPQQAAMPPPLLGGADFGSKFSPSRASPSPAPFAKPVAARCGATRDRRTRAPPARCRSRPAGPSASS